MRESVVIRKNIRREREEVLSQPGEADAVPLLPEQLGRGAPLWFAVSCCHLVSANLKMPDPREGPWFFHSFTQIHLYSTFIFYFYF